jgi:hypothetical protein
MQVMGKPAAAGTEEIDDTDEEEDTPEVLTNPRRSSRLQLLTPAKSILCMFAVCLFVTLCGFICMPVRTCAAHYMGASGCVCLTKKEILGQADLVFGLNI